MAGTGQAGPVDACVLRIDLLVGASSSLKAKRTVVRHLVDTARHRFRVAAAEVDFLDQWQRAVIAFAAVGSTGGHVGDVLNRVERFVWSHPEVTVLSCSRHWLDTDDQ